MQLRIILADQSLSSELFQLAQLKTKPWLVPHWSVKRIGFSTGHHNGVGIRLSKYELLIIEGLPSTKIFGIAILLSAASQLLARMNSSCFPSPCWRELSNKCLLIYVVGLDIFGRLESPRTVESPISRFVDASIPYPVGLGGVCLRG